MSVHYSASAAPCFPKNRLKSPRLRLSTFTWTFCSHTNGPEERFRNLLFPLFSTGHAGNYSLSSVGRSVLSERVYLCSAAGK